ncbi:MAG TPA: hypothetical protein DCY20_08400 [Firmicutes bacterium]|nr:hypothetical protein [Bacillota bacterium]
MKELITWYYQLQIDHLEQLEYIYYSKLGNRFLYIIPIGKEKNTTFFHLLQLLQYSQKQRILISQENTTTVLYDGIHYYVLESTVPLHERIDFSDLNIPTIYSEPYPVAGHLKQRWLAKNQFHEEQLNLLIDKLPSENRLIFFDLATYYIHLNEQAYTFINQIKDANFNVSLCHMRLTPNTYKFEFFAPQILTLDNKVRCYCEYMRDELLNDPNRAKIRSFVTYLHQTVHLTQEEWILFYARLFFPSHFYDALHSLRNDEEIDVPLLYSQALDYSKILYYFPKEIQAITGVFIPIPSWVTEEAQS